jgi:hypothetical protein
VGRLGPTSVIRGWGGADRSSVVDVTAVWQWLVMRRTLGGAGQCRVNDHSTRAFDPGAVDAATGTTV